MADVITEKKKGFGKLDGIYVAAVLSCPIYWTALTKEFDT